MLLMSSACVQTAPTSAARDAAHSNTAAREKWVVRIWEFGPSVRFLYSYVARHQKYHGTSRFTASRGSQPSVMPVTGSLMKRSLLLRCGRAHQHARPVFLFRNSSYP